ncbi:MAG: hypothetical protein ACRDVE_14700 [Actinocrinis sp.]
MADDQFSDDFEVAEADAAEQARPAGGEDGDAPRGAADEADVLLEADPADAAEQAVSVPVDDDEYR